MTKTNPDIIVPAIPVHVAYEWTRKKLTPKFNIKPTSIPDMLLDELPNPIIGPVGMAYASISDFMCPDNCPEPAEICIVTKKPRIYLLFQKLKCLNVGSFKSFVIQSEQLAPGVGGYSPKALFNLLSAIKKSSSPVLLSTACSCHGVINAFKFIRK
jgi:hypothetical protein